VKIIIGSDHIGFGLKEYIKLVLRENNVEYTDAGVFDATPMDYPDIAVIVAKEVIDGKFDRGILICGTGIGMAITANKVKGIRAAVCHDIYSAERSRKSNNAQIMALGALIVGNALAKSLVEVWLQSEFQGGGSAKKIEKISLIEQQQ
jgi:ribose 5-phosphate isomerase B